MAMSLLLTDLHLQGDWAPSMLELIWRSKKCNKSVWKWNEREVGGRRQGVVCFQADEMVRFLKL